MQIIRNYPKKKTLNGIKGSSEEELFDLSIPDPIVVDFTKFTTPKECYDYCKRHYSRWFDEENCKLLDLEYADTHSVAAYPYKCWRVGCLNTDYYPDQTQILGFKFTDMKRKPVKVECKFLIKGTMTKAYWFYSLFASRNVNTASGMYPAGIVDIKKEGNNSDPLTGNNGIWMTDGYANNQTLIQRFNTTTINKGYTPVVTDPYYLRSSIPCRFGLINYHKQYNSTHKTTTVIPYYVYWGSIKIFFK